MNDVKLSVCMVTYNHEAYIAQAVESALSQRTNFPFEIVIGEDCSTDATPNILRRIADRNPNQIRLRLEERNQGGKRNFMQTFAACRGQFVTILEGDDYWTCTEKLQIQVDALEVHPEWSMCFHPSECVYESGLRGPVVYPPNWTKPVAAIEDLFESNFMATTGVVFRNRLFPGLPNWFEKINLGDWPLHILNASHGDIGFLPRVMAAYRIHRNGLWSGASPYARLADIFKMFTAIDHHFAGKYTAQIDHYRLETLRIMMSDVDAVKNDILATADELKNADTERQHEASYASTTPATLHEAWHSLNSEIACQTHHFETLAEDHRKLHTLHDALRKSLPFKVAREIQRPFRDLRRFLERRMNRSEQTTQPTQSSSSKAA